MARTSEAQSIYTPRLDVTPEAELNALAAVYKFVLDSNAKKQDRPAKSGPENAKVGSTDDPPATAKYT